MQLESRHIYAKVSENLGLHPDLVKSIGDIVFKELSELQRNAPDLILEVRGLGRRFVRKSKLMEKLAKAGYERRDILRGNSYYGKTIEEVDREEEILHRLLARYEKFLEKKAHYKKLRYQYENPTSVESPVQEEALPEAGQNHPGKRQGLPAREPAVVCKQGQDPKTTQSY